MQQGVEHSIVQHPLAPPGGGRLRTILVLALLAGTLALIVPHPMAVYGFAASAGTLVIIALGLFLLRQRAGRQHQFESAGVTAFIAKDSTPSFIATRDGEIISQNLAAETAFTATQEATLAGVLKDHFANPVGILYRLQSRATATGSAREEAVAQCGYRCMNCRPTASYGGSNLWPHERDHGRHKKA